MALALSLLAALAWGGADFVGGLATRRSASSFPVVVVSQLFGLALVLALFAFVPGTPSLAAFELGLLAGLGGAAGLFFLYRALAIGRMSVVSPLSAVVAAVVPALVGFASGERLGALALAGIACALLAVGLICAAEPQSELEGAGVPPQRGILSALAAGLGFGAFLSLIALAPAREAGLLPLIGARLSSIGALAATATTLRASLRPAPGTLGTIAAAGLLDMGANALFVIATHTGMLAVVSVLTSLYPAGTVFLAALLLHERLAWLQWTGVAAALVGVALLAR